MFPLNDPARGIEQVFRSVINGHTSALAHGDVVSLDTTQLATAIAAGTKEVPVVPSTDINDALLIGVVWDPEGYGVAVGGRCVVMTRGYHSAVKCAANVNAAGVIVGNNTDGTGVAVAQGSQLVGNTVGVCIVAVASGVAGVLVDVR